MITLESTEKLLRNLSGIWRYREDYRLFADIRDDIVTIEIFEVEHRSNLEIVDTNPVSFNRVLSTYLIPYIPI